MPKSKKLPSSPCNHAGHSQHMCALADEYFHIHCPDEYRAIVTNPEYKCQFCGRATKSPTNLCYPVEL
jgi:hypothetical protein